MYFKRTKAAGSGSAVSPCAVAVEVFGEVFPAVGELRTVQPQPYQKGAEGELLVVGGGLSGADTPCRFCVVVQRKGKGNVAPDLTGMRGAVEGSQLYRVMPVEEAMKIDEVIPRFIVF